MYVADIRPQFDPYNEVMCDGTAQLDLLSWLYTG